MMKNSKNGSYGYYCDPELEELIRKKDAELKEQARKNAKHLAAKNLPASSRDRLPPYIGDLNAGYGALSAFVNQRILPATHPVEGKLEIDKAKEKDKEFDLEIQKKEEKNRNAEYELAGFDPATLIKRILLALLSTALITLGEIAFNAKAFEITGHNLLFSLLLAVAISVSVYLFAHFVPIQYKRTDSDIKKKVILWGSLALITGVFIAMAVFRSQVLARNHINVNPFFFVIINVFLFVVSALVSYYLMPGWDEISRNARQFRIYNGIRKGNQEIIRLKKSRGEHKDAAIERAKFHIRVPHYAENLLERIRKLYREAVELFKQVNLINRSDSGVPDCFYEEPPELDVNYYDFSSANSK